MKNETKQLKYADFGKKVNAEGYQVTYKGQNIGGAAIMGKFKGRGRSRIQQISDYSVIAETHIRDIVNGFGEDRFYKVIEKINSTQVLPNKLTLLVTGSGKRADEPENELLLRTDDATLHFKRGSEFGKLANALVDSYNERSALVDALKDCYKCLTMDSDMEEDFAPEIKKIKKVLGW